MLSVEADAFAGALKRAGRVNAAYGAMAILHGVRLVADDRHLSCWRSDLELTVEAWVPCSAGTLDVIVPAEPLARYVSQVEGPLGIGTKGSALVVEAARSHVVLPTFDPKDWPMLSHVEGPSIALSGADVKRVAYAAPTAADKLPKMEGVHFSGTHVEACNSHRLARVPYEAPEALVPVHAFADLADFEMVADERRVSLVTEGETRTVQMLHHSYPDTEKSIVKFLASPHHLTADRLGLIAAVKIASAASSTADGYGRNARLRPGSGSLTVTSRAEDTESEALVDAEADFDFPIQFVTRYLLELLGACEAETVTINVQDALKPVHVTDGAALHVLMPQRVTT